MKLRFRLIDNGWALESPLGEKLAEFELPPVDSPAYRDCALYGLKQWVADGGAKEEGTPLRTRINGMIARHRAIMSGELSIRSGRGAVGRLPDATIYLAAVGAGLLQDNDAMRKAWTAASATARAAVARDQRVIDWISRQSAPETGDAVADLIAAAESAAR